MHADLPLFIRKIKDIGYKVKLDTNGTNPKMLQELIDSKLIDYVAMDIKNSFDNYPKTVGVKFCDLTPIQQSINILQQNKVDYEFRTTLVKDLHDMDAISQMSQELKGAKRIYLQRFVDNDNCIQYGLKDISKEQAEKYANILQTTIGEVKLRGYV